MIDSTKKPAKAPEEQEAKTPAVQKEKVKEPVKKAAEGKPKAAAKETKSVAKSAEKKDKVPVAAKVAIDKEAKAIEAKAAEAKAAEPKAIEAKATELEAIKPKEVEDKATEAKATEPKEIEAKAIEPKEIEAKAIEPKATEKAMSNEPQKPKSDFMEKYWGPFLRPVVTLMCVCLITSLLLGLTNAATKPVIDANTLAAADSARKKLLPSVEDSGFNLLPLEGEGANVIAVYEAGNKTGYVIEAYGIGYGGRVPVLVAFGADNKIAGVTFLENKETPGLGKKLNTDPKFSAQFTGFENSRILPNDIDGIASSTISTGAALTGINAAITYYNDAILDIAEEELTPEGVRKMLLPNATEITSVEVSGDNIKEAYQGDDGNYIIYATGDGYESDVTAAVAFDGEGNILGMWLDTADESAGFGREVAANTSFIEQFTGKTSSEGFEAVGGATITSKAVAAALDAAAAYLPVLASGAAPPPTKPAEPTIDDINLQLLPEAGKLEALQIAAEGVTEAYMAKDGSVIIYAQSKGYDSDVTAGVAMGPDGVILGVWLNTSKETKGFGRDIQENEEYMASFIGKTSAEGVDTIADATVTSTAIASAVDIAVAARALTTPEGVRAAMLPDAVTITKVEAEIDGIEEAYKADDGNFIICAKAEGFESKVLAIVAMDANGEIIKLVLDTSKETKKFGRDLQANAEYLASFEGQTSADDVDGVADVTVTSKAVAEAVNAALAAIQQVKEAA